MPSFTKQKLFTFFLLLLLLSSKSAARGWHKQKRPFFEYHVTVKARKKKKETESDQNTKEGKRSF